jgi:UDP-3-O-[3-hydroxymyristoyl] N-acetylglucosamine deacetylase
MTAARTPALTVADHADGHSGLRNRARPRQRTLGKGIEVTGTGIHTGQRSRVRLTPADADAGLVFSDGCRSFSLRADRLVESRRCTAVGDGQFSVQTVEHLLAALYGLGVDNAVIDVEGPEVPILDGSALGWVQLIRAAGICTQDRLARVYAVREPVGVVVGESCAVATPSSVLRLTCVTAFDHPLLGVQTGSVVIRPSSFARELAPARTFAMWHEVQAILDSGLARGGDLKNALIVYEDRYSDELRVPDECLKHKMLDVLGDLCVLGMRLHAHITVFRPGHAVNARLVGRLAETLAGETTL